MVREGVLSPVEAGKFIAENAQFVTINDEGIEKLTDEIMKSMSDKLDIPETGAKIQYPDKEDPIAVDWVFVADALNFCFWNDPGEQKWTVNGHTGYYALEAALARAIKEGIRITDPAYYSKITVDQLHYVMRGDNEAKIPLFTERLIVLHEVGKILSKRYKGTFVTCVKAAKHSAEALLDIIVNDFPCFRDEATFNGQDVAIYKRAQILVADLWNFFGGTGYGDFNDINKITMFADYRIPQVLVYFGVLSYDNELMFKLKNDELLPSGSTEEVEIRGCSIHAVEILKNNLEDKLRYEEDVQVPNSSLIDYYLWCYRRKYAKEIDSVPFHKTRGIYY